MKHLQSTGATWVSIVVTQYQWNITSTEIFPLYNGSEVTSLVTSQRRVSMAACRLGAGGWLSRCGGAAS